MRQKEKIIQALSKSGHPVLLKELMQTLKLHREDRQEVKQLLRKMIREGEIVRLRGKRYGLLQKMALVSGQFKGHREGYGFVIPDHEGDAARETDVYIASGKNRDAMHGDRVVARIEKQKGEGRREGRIIRILERAHRQLVGRFESGSDFGFIIPADRRIVQAICASSENSLHAKNGDIVIAEILSYPEKGRTAEGKVVKIIGRPEDDGIDTEIVIASYQLTPHFPEAVLEAAADVTESVTPEMVKGRADLRHLPTVTIDGERARDFDDAISIEAREGGYCLRVHIADVAHYVTEGSLLDQEAYLRGTSVYFPDRVLPMFPERLSNGICSLKPKADRLTLTVEMCFSPEGNQLSQRMVESVIQSDERMTYTAVRKILEEEDQPMQATYAPLVPQFRMMKKLAMKLRVHRLKRGSLDFDLPEPEIILSLTGETIDIVREERNVAHQIIEEFMLAANETVAREMTRRGIPFLYRIHEPPSADRMAALGDMMRHFGLKQHLGKKVGPKDLSQILEAVKDHPEEKLVNQVMLRSMQQARYSAENKGHFGLASEDYAHFTSPIRRYPDLLVHRFLKRVLRSQSTDLEKERWAKKLPEIASHCSARERVAVEAEREVIQRKRVKFMSDKIGECYKGVISGVAAYGFFVQLETYFVEGLVRVSSLYDDYYVFDEKRYTLIGRSKRRSFRLGQPVRVAVAQVDIEHQKIDFKLVEGRGK